MISGSAPDIGHVLAHYPPDCRPETVEPLGSCGGLSGALFWRLATGRGRLCLRRWPAACPQERLARIHEALRFVGSRCGIPLPVPIENRRGGTWIEAAGHLWELTPWLAGAPAARLPLDVEKVQAAMAALAELHLPLAAFSASAATAPAAGPPPGLRRRLDLFAARQAPAQRAAGTERLPDGCGWETALVSLEEAVRRMGGPLRGSVARDLMAATQVRVPLQVCLRDIWRPHVLFERSAVTGVVDFGALDVDCVAGDIARLLGSLAGESAHGWQTGLAAYEAVRPLGDQERGLVPVYDRSGVLLSALHWIEWLRVERRPFPDKSAVRERLVELTERLLSLA